MLDGLSLDQLRAFIAAVDEGSFSAGARKLHRAQSAVSELVSNLEAQLGVTLFDRSERYPKLTAAGIQLVADARSVVANVDLLKARAKGISRGLESELSAVVDVLFPIEAIAESAKEFRDRFPRTPLRLYVEALGGAPGIHSAAQVKGWKLVTRAVHQAGGRMFLQLWHVGRVSHSSFQPFHGAPVAPLRHRARAL